MSTTGTIGYLAFGVESSAGTAASSVEVCGYAPFESEGMALTRNDIQLTDIMGTFDVPLTVEGPQIVGGPVTMTADYNTIGFFLRSWFDATSSTTGSGAPWANGIANSDAAVRVHQFFAGYTQFQQGSGSDTPCLTLEIYRGPNVGVGSAFAYYNCTGNTFEFTSTAGQPAKFTIDMMGRAQSRKARATTGSYQTLAPIMWHQASISVGGAASVLFESLTIRGNNNLEIVRTLDGSLTAANRIKRAGYRTVEVTGTLLWQDDTEYDRFIAGSNTPVKVLFTSNSMQKLLIDIPSMRYKAFPVADGGPGRINVQFQADALYHAGSLTAMAWILVSSKVSPFTTNSIA